jgi:hypothetical protein
MVSWFSTFSTFSTCSKCSATVIAGLAVVAVIAVGATVPTGATRELSTGIMPAGVVTAKVVAAGIATPGRVVGTAGGMASWLAGSSRMEAVSAKLSSLPTETAPW